jgi:hypothetical protein
VKAIHDLNANKADDILQQDRKEEEEVDRVPDVHPGLVWDLDARTNQHPLSTHKWSQTK